MNARDPKLEELRTRLVEIHEKYASYKAAGVARTDSTKRRAMIKALKAVVAFLKSHDMPAELVNKAGVAFANIETGAEVTYASNQPSNRSPDPIHYQILRGQIAADITLAMRGPPKQSLEDACKQLRKASPPTLLKNGNWKTLVGWRNKVKASAPHTVQRKAYEERLKK